MMLRQRGLRAVIVMMVPFLTLVSGSAQAALKPLEENDLASVTGTGLAMAFEDFRWLIKPTSYFEQVGENPVSGSRWQRGDLRWYGLNVSGAGAGGNHWDEQLAGGFGTSCDASGLECPRGGILPVFAAHDNPYVLRAFSPQGIDWGGNQLNTDANNPDKSIYEFLAPSIQPDYTLSFWGELEVGRNGGNEQLTEGTGDILKSQTIIRGNAANSAFRLFQFTQPDNETFALLYHSYLKGDFRFSVNQHQSASSDNVGEPVRFEGNEGLHFKNVDAYLPLGQLYYQALTVDTVGDDGNFSLTIPSLPNEELVYKNFYALRDDDTRGYETARLALKGDFQGNDSGLKNYTVSHGYSHWGDWYPDCTHGPGKGDCVAPNGNRNDYNEKNDGIFFRKCASCEKIKASARKQVGLDSRNNSATYVHYESSLAHTTGSGSNTHIETGVANIGDARAHGMLINQLSFTSCVGSVTC